jgi:hypothetical protein
MDDCNCQEAGNFPMITFHDVGGKVLDYVRQDCPVHGVRHDEDGVMSWKWRRLDTTPAS